MRFSKFRVVSATFLCTITLIAVFTTGCSSDDEENDVTFGDDVESIFNSNCKGCHETGNNYAPIIFGYEEVKDAAMNKSLLDRIQAETNPMPPGGNMSSEDIQVFLDWADGGYLE